MSFTHLHVHSHYSLLEGLPKIKPLVKAAKKRGFSSIALTDSGALYGAIEFYKACTKEGIKPIIGTEVYHGPRTLHDKDLEKDKDLFELVLLATSYEGYRNLMSIVSVGQLEGFFREKPRVDFDLLRKHSKDVIALSGSIRGQVPQLLLAGKTEEAKKIAITLGEIFGKDNFYLELQDHPAVEGQLSVNTGLIDLSKETGIPLVVSRDVHYLDPDDVEAQDVLPCIKNGWKVAQPDRDDFRHVDRSLNTEKDIRSRFRHVEEAVDNTGKIAERVNIEIELDAWHFAPVDLPKGKTADEHLRDMAYESAPKFYPEMGDVITERIDYELDIIKTKGYAPYFLCVADYVKYAKDNGIVESTRGSAAGSLVSYVVGITTVDPIRFKLPFERFLNPYRPSAPDIDTDFADDRREEMIEYVTEKYGVDHVAQIITFGTMAARASARDVGRTLGLSYGFCDQVAKLIPFGAQGFPMTIERALKEEPDLKKLYDTNADVKRLLDLAQKVEGCARHTSIHAAGVVISPTPLTDFTPIQRETGGEKLVTQYEMKSVEAAGLLKNDFLGIRNLSILGKAVEIVKKTVGDDVDIYSLPLDDKEVFAMLARGETMGVFQLGSSGMTRWIKELKPTNIEDIMAMVALYRPGPMDFIPEYIGRKHNPETVDYPHPDLEEILEMSLGLLIYQDDVMLTAIKLAGYDWLEADKFRKAMGKKIPELMLEQEQKFKKGCVANNIPKATATQLWERIKPFATYAFNKAHAASYGMVAYQTAYMKANYPVQYMTAVLQAEASDTEKVAAIVYECKRMGIEVLPPDVNESFKNFAMVSKPGEPGRIRFGLTAIKNVGDHICEVLYRERKENGQYKDLEDLLSRANDKDLNKRSLESLAKAGAMDGFGHDRGLLISNIENILHFTKQLKEAATTNQQSLFAGSTIDIGSHVVLKDAPDANMDEKLMWEKELLGIYVSSHPFAYYDEQFAGSLVPLSEVEAADRDSWVTIGGIIDSAKKKITKKGSVMMFVTLQDQSGSMELLVFPKTYAKTQDVWRERNIICVVGKTPREQGDNKVFVENVYELTRDNIGDVQQWVRLSQPRDGGEKKASTERSVTISLTKELLQDKTEELKKVFDSSPGGHRVFLNVDGQLVKTQTSIEGTLETVERLEDVAGKESVVVN